MLFHFEDLWRRKAYLLIIESCRVHNQPDICPLNQAPTQTMKCCLVKHLTVIFLTRLNNNFAVEELNLLKNLKSLFLDILIFLYMIINIVRTRSGRLVQSIGSEISHKTDSE